MVIFLSLCMLASSAAWSMRVISMFTTACVSQENPRFVSGFILPYQRHKVLIRAMGPSAASTVKNAIQNPAVFLHDEQWNIVDSNSDWILSPQKDDIIETGLAPSNDKESVILRDLDPGMYSVEVISENGETGCVGLEIYDLGEVEVVYDDFSGNLLSSDMWTVESGTPTVDGNYLECLANDYRTDLRAFLCKVTSTAKSVSWGVAIQPNPGTANKPLYIQYCPGKRHGTPVCGEFVIEADHDVTARIVELNSLGLPNKVLSTEVVGRLETGAFLNIQYARYENTINFWSLFQDSDVITIVNRLLPELDELYNEVPIVIYSYSSTPVNSTYLIDFVEK